MATSTLITSEWYSIYFSVKWVFIFLDALLILIFFYSLKKAWFYRPHFVFEPEEQEGISAARAKMLQERWEKILKKAGSAPPQSLTLAVIEADKFVDDALKEMKLRGDTMADRLMQLDSDKVKSMKKLWKAHKIRNQLVHAPDFTITHREATDILMAYEDFLREIKALY